MGWRWVWGGGGEGVGRRREAAAIFLPAPKAGAGAFAQPRRLFAGSHPQCEAALVLPSHHPGSSWILLQPLGQLCVLRDARFLKTQGGQRRTPFPDHSLGCHFSVLFSILFPTACPEAFKFQRQM